MMPARRPAGPARQTAASPVRVRPGHVEWVAERLGERDWQIIEAVNRLRILSGEQIETLFFSSLTSRRSRIVTRSRVLKRLIDWRVLVPLTRSIGGADRGSSGLVFALDSAGQRLIAGRQLAEAGPLRVRRPGTPGERTVRHQLAVSALYVDLVALSRSQGFSLEEFVAEPGCWWPDGLRGYLKPDAYLRLSTADVADYWWIEHDEATESLPTVRRKLETYLDFIRRGQLGPNGVIPRVLVSTVTEARRAAIASLVTRLPDPAAKLFAVVHAGHAAPYLVTVLRE